MQGLEVRGLLAPGVLSGSCGAGLDHADGVEPLLRDLIDRDIGASILADADPSARVQTASVEAFDVFRASEDEEFLRRLAHCAFQ